MTAREGASKVAPARKSTEQQKKTGRAPSFSIVCFIINDIFRTGRIKSLRVTEYGTDFIGDLISDLLF